MSKTADDDGGQPGARERIVYTAAQHLRTHGPAASSLRAIVRDADAPWGSLRHYFPGGKDQILSEGLEWSGAYAAEQVRAYMTTNPTPTPSGLFVHLVDGWADDLKRREFGRGCPVAAVSIDPGDETSGTAKAARSALDRWLTAIEAALSSMSVADARAQARVMLSLLEGAIILSRIQRSAAALDDVRQLAEHFRPTR